MLPLLLLSSFFIHVIGIIVSDIGCPCATVKNAITTPAAATTIPVGCTVKPDWNGAQATWCLTDETTPCGTLQAGFGHADYCTQASIYPNIQSTTVYTGQTINITWNVTNVIEPELIRVGYPGRVFGTTNVSTQYFTTFIPDAGAFLTTNSILTLNTTNPLVTGAIQGFTLVQSKIQQIWTYNQGNLVVSTGGGGGGGTSIPCDGRNLTFIWQSVGNAQIGNASIYVRSSGGGGGGISYIGTTVLIPSVAPFGNNTVNYTCPRSATVNTFTTYYAVLTVRNPLNPAPYTLNSVSFSLAVAPTSTPTASLTPSNSPTPSITSSITSTISVTPTPSLSFGSTASITPSGSPTMPSQTPTISVTATNTPSSSSTSSESPTNTQTPSETPTPRSIIQIGTINTQQFVDAPTLIGSVVGSAAAAITIFGLVRLYQRRQLNQIRRARLKAASRRAITDRQAIYGVAPETAATVVMHQYGPQPTGRHPRRPNSRTSPRRA